MLARKVKNCWECSMASISKKINNSVVQSIQIDQTIRDTEIKGFGVRRRKAGISYFLQTRINGRLRWITIGGHGSPWNPTTARKEALRLLTDVSNGVDPNLERKNRREVPTVKALATEFLEDHGKKLSAYTLYSYRLLLQNDIIPALGQYRIDDLDKTLISRAHNKWSDRPRTANYCLSIVSKLLSWSEEKGLRSENTNPCNKIKKYKENKRERYLSSDEFERLGNVLAQASENGSENPYVIAAIRLLMLTGARLNEILSLKWSAVDLERSLLLLEESKTGQKAIYLNDAAKQVLSEIPKLSDNPYVIVGQKAGAHLVNLRKPWCSIREQARLDDVRLHDLRHSFASLAAASGASLPLIGKLLGHSQPQTTARYTHLADDPLHEVNRQVGEKLRHVLKLK